jgi:hypothetical protein
VNNVLPRFHWRRWLPGRPRRCVLTVKLVTQLALISADRRLERQARGLL